jgi:hypothetical protein
LRSLSISPARKIEIFRNFFYIIIREFFYMKKKFILATMVVSLFFFSACEDEAIPVPLPPPLPSDNAQIEGNSLVKTDSPNQSVKNANPVAPAASPPVAAKAAPVVKPVPVAKPAPAVKNVTAPGDDTGQLSYGKYTIQIAVFPSEATAKKLVKKMAENSINSYYAKVNNPAQLLGAYYRVRIGYFNERSVAENFARTRLEPLGYVWWVDRSNKDSIGTDLARAKPVPVKKKTEPEQKL